MKEKEATRIVTDDLACRLLSDMIKKEDENTTTGLLYGVNCTSPIVVPIPYVKSKCDCLTERQIWGKTRPIYSK
jgi:hypothetical protein